MIVFARVESELNAQTLPTTRSLASASTQPSGAPNLSVTEHQIESGGQTLRYKVTTGLMPMVDETGKPKADVFFVAYDRQFDTPAPPTTSPATRPITFVFNGGPGAASAWLHLGTAGPMIVKLDDNGDAPAPPYSLVENDATWLDITDLIFIDPVGTGYSRAAKGENPQQFWGVQEDTRSVGEFIRLYLTRYRRWASPKFIAGESYGTTRAAALSEHLLDQDGIALDGIIFISSVLDFQTIQPGNGNLLPYALYLPSYAAVAWYHKKLAPDLQADLDKTIAAAQQWTIEQYIPALARGSALPPDQHDAIARQLSRFTGLDEKLIEKADLKIEPSLFEKQLLGDARRVIGRFDGRLSGYDPDPLSPWPDYDPSLSPFLSAYTATFNDYVRRQLNYESDLNYELLNGKVGPWNFDAQNRYTNVADNLAGAMVKNPAMRVLFCSGFFDLATPFFSTTYTLDHLEIGPEQRKNITIARFDGGHMLYHPKASREQLKAKVRDFIERSIEPGNSTGGASQPSTQEHLPRQDH